jgi:hypothetical protein
VHLAGKIGRDPAERMQRYHDRRAAAGSGPVGASAHVEPDGE